MKFLVRICSVILIVVAVVANDCHTKGLSSYFQITCRKSASWVDFQVELQRATKEEKNFSFQKLVAIFLTNNNIKSLPGDVFKNLSGLEYLELGNNKIESLEPGTFKSLTNLSLLNLWNNEIKEFDSHIFDGLVSLKTLDLHNNKLTNLPPGIFDKLEQLQVVNLSGNRFETLPGTLFHQNHQLNTVRIRFSSTLTNLPSGLFSNLKNLKAVQLDGSSLESLPEDIFQGSPELRDIFLAGNNLATLPKQIFEGLEKLQKLFLHGNRIEYLPDDIFSTNQNLEDVNLNHNSIKNISGSLLSGLKSLKKLQMQNNSISVIDKNAFKLLKKVEEIYLSHNNISDILVLDDDYMRLSVFHRCERLRKMDLSFNKINRIFSDWTTQPSQFLNYLDLSYNEIDRIRETDMDFKQPQQFRIDLSGNKIKRIDMSSFFEENFLQETRSSIEMILTNNPLECDCFLYDFLHYLDGTWSDLSSKLHIEIGSMECSSPKELEGTLLSDLKSEDYRCVASDLEEYEGVCPESCSRWIQPSDYKLIFDCAYKNLTEVPETMCKFASSEYINEVDLTGNFITNFPNMTQIGYDRVGTLILSNNNISTIPKDVFSPALVTLELDNNKITALSSSVLAHLENTTLESITLGGNPWKCDCDARHFQYYIQNGGAKGKFQILDVNNITCQNSKKRLKTMTVNELCPTMTKMMIGISMAVAFLGLMFGVLAALYYRFQREMKVWLYAHRMCLWFVTEGELDKDKPYDAFISYSHKDEDFVVSELVPKLEQGPRPFKLCIHFRDWLAGEWIPAQIAKSVNDSKRTIVVVSPNFVQSEWGRLEFRAAHSQALNEGRGRVVVILYGDIEPNDELEPELKAYLSMNTYAKWGDPWFWDKLRYFLPHKSELPDNKTLGSKILKMQDPSVPLALTFNKGGVKPFSENDKPLTESVSTIDAEVTILEIKEGDDVCIDMTDD